MSEIPRKRKRRETTNDAPPKVRPILPKVPEVYQVQVNDNGIIKTYLLPIRDIPPYKDPEYADMNNPIDLASTGDVNHGISTSVTAATTSSMSHMSNDLEMTGAVGKPKPVFRIGFLKKQDVRDNILVTSHVIRVSETSKAQKVLSHHTAPDSHLYDFNAHSRSIDLSLRAGAELSDTEREVLIRKLTSVNLGRSPDDVPGRAVQLNDEHERSSTVELELAATKNREPIQNEVSHHLDVTAPRNTSSEQQLAKMSVDQYHNQTMDQSKQRAAQVPIGQQQQDMHMINSPSKTIHKDAKRPAVGKVIGTVTGVSTEDTYHRQYNDQVQPQVQYTSSTTPQNITNWPGAPMTPSTNANISANSGTLLRLINAQVDGVLESNLQAHLQLPNEITQFPHHIMSSIPGCTTVEDISQGLASAVPANNTEVLQNGVSVCNTGVPQITGPVCSVAPTYPGTWILNSNMPPFIPIATQVEPARSAGDQRDFTIHHGAPHTPTTRPTEQRLEAVSVRENDRDFRIRRLKDDIQRHMKLANRLRRDTVPKPFKYMY